MRTENGKECKFLHDKCEVIRQMFLEIMYKRYTKYGSTVGRNAFREYWF